MRKWKILLISFLLLSCLMVVSGKKKRYRKKNTKVEHIGGFLIYRVIKSRVQYLLMRQVKDGYWSPPKGHTHKKEPVIDAAVRETWEETGWHANHDYRIDLRHSVYFEFKNEDKKYVTEKVQLWPAKQFKFRKPLRFSKEHSAYAWFSFERALGVIQREFRNALVQGNRIIRRNEGIDVPGKYPNQEEDIASIVIG